MSVKTKKHIRKTYNCPVCNKFTYYSDLCDWCYNVESNIDNYLSTKEGIKRIQQKLKEVLK